MVMNRVGAETPPVHAGAVAATRRLRRRQFRGLPFILPWAIGFVVFQFFPFVFSLVLSFMRWDLGQSVSFVGIENYRELLLEDQLLRKSVINTVIYTVFHVPGIIVLAFAVAALLNQKVRGVALYRTMFYLPSITTGVATAIIWIWLFQPAGLVNMGLQLFGIQGPNWLNSLTWSLPALIIMSFWSLGTPMILFLAGLQGIPDTLYEAAMIDGAGWWAKMRHVTIPLMTPYVFLSTILNVIGSFQVFTSALVMTQGGPGDSTTFILMVMYWAGWQWFRMGYASAIAWVLLAVILVLTVIQFRLARRWVYYEFQKSETGGR